MKKYLFLIIFSLIVILIFLGCTPSESAVQTAIASTAQYEEDLSQQTQEAENALMEKTKKAQETEQAILNQTQTAEAISFSQTQTAIPRQCTPGGNFVDFENDASPEYMDITMVETSLEGNTLTAVFHLQQLPNEISIDEREKGTGEYYWGVSVDVDNDMATGSDFGLTVTGSGIDYELSLFHFSGEREIPLTGPIEEVLRNEADVWEAQEDGGMWTYRNASFVVDYENNTIQLEGYIPDINENSILYFSTQKGMGGDSLCE